MSGGAVLETARLVLRPMRPDDLEGLLGVFGDPTVMASFDEEPFDRDQVRRWLERNLAHQREHGYGLFAVCLKEDDRLIGDCGLEVLEVAAPHLRAGACRSGCE